MPRVLNKRTDLISKDAVFIGRPSKWGNPFKMSRTATRQDVVKAYEVYLLSNKELMDSLIELRGKDLVCFCAPEPCHGDVLIKYANRMICPYCKSSNLAYSLRLTQQESGTWSEIDKGIVFESLDDALRSTEVECFSCGFTFNHHEEG